MTCAECIHWRPLDGHLQPVDDPAAAMKYGGMLVGQCTLRHLITLEVGECKYAAPKNDVRKGDDNANCAAR